LIVQQKTDGSAGRGPENENHREENGMRRILSVDNQSGHYRPNSKSMEKVDAALKKLYEKYPGAFDKNSKWRKE
jgi:hypothetical protein